MNDEPIPYNLLCTCEHIAASHWYVAGSFNHVWGRCVECGYDEEGFLCRDFKKDNLKYLAKKYNERNGL